MSLVAKAEKQTFTHPGLYDFNENIWWEGTTTPVKDYIQNNFPDAFSQIDWSMNHQACFYEIKREITFGCPAPQKIRLNI